MSDILESKSLTIVVPCYNEEDCLPNTAQALTALLESAISDNLISPDSHILFVDDGSKDRTWTIITELAQKNSHIKGLKLSRNFGHQNALIAGLGEVSTDFCISIDADLQDDINAIPLMIEKYHSGCHIVYGQRVKRKTDTFFKKNTAVLYYKILDWLGIESVQNHADFRLMSRQAVERLMLFNETHIYIRGLIPLIGLKSGVVSYDRQERTKGQTKYSLTKMFSLAVNGIVSFSSKPLYLISFLGFFVSCAAFILAAWVLWIKFFSEATVPGWASTVIPIYFIGGVQLFSVGLLGIYVSKIFDEAKKRPRFIIEKTTCNIEK